MRRIIIFDTTLRDGELCPGASLTPSEKLEIAKQLARLGVDEHPAHACTGRTFPWGSASKRA